MFSDGTDNSLSLSSRALTINNLGIVDKCIQTVECVIDRPEDKIWISVIIKTRNKGQVME